MVNLRGDMWGTFAGAVGTTQGARLGAVYTSGDAAVIELGELNSICFTEPTFCSSGFTVSLWLKRKTLYFNKVTQKQVILTIDGRVTFKLYQKFGRTEEHLAVRISVLSRYERIYAFVSFPFQEIYGLSLSSCGTQRT